MQCRAKLFWLMVFSLFMIGALGEKSLMAEDPKNKNVKAAGKVLDFKMKSLDGKQVDLNQYKGDVVLVVNVASECGLTPQYTQLQALHEKYGPKGLRVLGFPCNQFGRQEPGSSEEIQEFCSNTR